MEPHGAVRRRKKLKKMEEGGKAHEERENATKRGDGAAAQNCSRRFSGVCRKE